MKTHFTHRHIVTLLALCLTLPSILHLIAGPLPPWPPVVPPGCDLPIPIDSPLQQGPIKDVLTITTRAYNSKMGTESAVKTVQTSGAVTVETNSQIRFESGGQITLKPGFRAKEGSYFQARIGFTYYALLTPTESVGLPLGLLWFSNTNNPVPDLILITLGLNHTQNHSGNQQVINLLQSARTYEYDDNSQLINAPGERKFKLDEEGNITGQQ